MGTMFQWGRWIMLKVSFTFILLFAILTLIAYLNPCQLSMKAEGILDFNYQGRCELEKPG